MGIGGVDLFLYCETDIDVIIDQVSFIFVVSVVVGSTHGCSADTFQHH